jgi:hypothetical protein
MQVKALRFHAISRFGLWVLVCLWLGSGCSFYNSDARPSRYLFPEGYVGWVRLNFKTDAPEPPIENGCYVFKFSPSGEIICSTQTKCGNTPADRYYYYSEDMRLTPTLPMSGVNVQHTDNLKEWRAYMFVGTYEESVVYNSRFPGRNEDGQPRIGLIKRDLLTTE